MLSTIQTKLAEIEHQHKVRVLFACESGSRGWGFPSLDSDYDVRFIYFQQADNYLSIDDADEIIELPVDAVLDINGWDIRKVLRLYRKSNAAIYEWLQSPIIYKQEGELLSTLQSLMSDYFSLKDGMHHYLGIAGNSFKALTGDHIKLKKYFYCIRAVLAAMWIVEKQSVPPMEFSLLRTLITDKDWNNEIDLLLVLKREANESTLVQPVSLLHSFITTEMERCNELAVIQPRKLTDIEPLNQLFRKLIHEI